MTKQKVFLDTNIVLSSIDSKSSCFLLQQVLNDYDFYISTIIEEEIEKKIRDSKRDRKEKNSLRLKINFFLDNLSITVLNDSHYKRKFIDKQENDKIICKIAIENDCDFLCTYNYKDFINCGIKIVAPTILLKNSSMNPQQILRLYFNTLHIINGNFAFYVGFDFKGIVQDIVIFKDRKNACTLGINTKGNLVLKKGNKPKPIKISKVSLQNYKSIKLYIVYYNNKINVYNLEDGNREILSKSIPELEILDKNIFPFCAKGSFYGHIRELSMYLLDKTQNEKLMSNKTLTNIKEMDSIEYLWGNITI
ncbi:MAG: hypothetical protein U9Q83_01355 [Bacteroidota bacterium]|nr:hypothetical protein [Bacteroidota bacterium]